MDEDKVLEKLRALIYVQYGNATQYAKEKGISKQYVSAVLNKKAVATDAMLHDIGLKKQKVITINYVSNKF